MDWASLTYPKKFATREDAQDGNCEPHAKQEDSLRAGIGPEAFMRAGRTRTMKAKKHGEVGKKLHFALVSGRKRHPANECIESVNAKQASKGVCEIVAPWMEGAK